MGIKTTISNNQGFTLLGAIIISAMLAAMILTASSYFYQRNRNQIAADNLKTFSQLRSNIQESASHTDSLSHAEDLQFQVLPTPVP